MAIGAASLASGSATAVDVTASGRITYGAAMRTEAPQPELLVTTNARLLGPTGLASGGQNGDDANNNFARGDVTSQVLKGFVDLEARLGSASARVRVKAWHDYALLNHGRPWGNNPNNYTAGAPLSDARAPARSRFSGVVVDEAYVQNAYALDAGRLLVRLGNQNLNWGERATFGGGLSAVNAADLPALRRPGAAPQELRVAQPMLLARLEPKAGLGVEAYYQGAFRPAALDMCGTFWANLDYLTEGCNRAFAGAPAASDRARVLTGAFIARMDNPTPNNEAQYGAALTWRSDTPGTEVALFHARYISRTPLAGMRKAGRIGPALIAGDPDGANLRYFTEYPGHIALYSLVAAHRRGADQWSGELTLRPSQPIQLPPSDVIVPFMNPAASALLHTDIDALAPGAIYHAYDRYRTAQLQLGWQHDWARVGPATLSGAAELVYKHVHGLPDPLVRRYGRADVFGSGPTNGVCSAPAATAWRQCSVNGYVTPAAAAYRLRVDARFGEVLPATVLSAQAIFSNEFKGWSYDFQFNQGRRSANLGLRAEYRQRYQVELVYLPVWGGVYNNLADRDQVALSVGIKF